jgi:hypothetical protein
MENKLILAGDVVGTDGDKLYMATTDVGSDGREFTQDHEIVCKKKDLKDLKAGDRVKVFGKLGRSDENRTVIISTQIEPYTDSHDLNVARLVGIAHRTFEFFPRIEGSGAFGNLLVTVDGVIYSGTAFGHTANMLSRNCTKGSTVKLQGRIDNREWPDRNGEVQSRTRIIADPDYTKVLEKAKMVDPLDELDDEKQAAAGI